MRMMNAFCGECDSDVATERTRGMNVAFWLLDKSKTESVTPPGERFDSNKARFVLACTVVAGDGRSSC